jgi:hypothetical protein
MWTCSVVASLCSCSLLDICFSDIQLDHKHGAEATGPQRRSIHLALRKGTGKEDFTHDRCVAGWRGKDYYHCLQLSLSMSLIYTLQSNLRTKRKITFGGICVVDNQNYKTCHTSF